MQGKGGWVRSGLSLLVGAITTMVVFGLLLALAWALVIQPAPARRMAAAVATGSVAVFAGGVAAGLLGRWSPVRHAVVFTTLFSLVSATYLFAFSLRTLFFIVLGAILGWLAGLAAQRILAGWGSGAVGEAAREE